METTPTAPPPINVPATEDKTVAIVAYLTLIGFIAAIVIHSNKKTQLGAFHLRQMLGFILAIFVVGACVGIFFFIPIINLLALFVWWVFMLFMLVCWVLGLVAAINGKMTPMPIIGPIFQKMLGTTFD
ncbi:MAG TPA: hypothetical protein VK742_12175 [Candidatus Sulfotelmatobacter sp.]|jgi:uncharacterized membrane protein|nr:hypothetical protein [Candidatus Sulfotelmatobacter sp.]